ncbi:hypothetical protein [Cellulomonas shaoxiangyii]|uniref:WXG100 family type VII secretion target n=1 Tax=Cellulomonas shaoxiangyii TaxID=2566013 RepID=A0A4P7SFJ4_9CELL|nr:hypothetical protein [Cellulomonas shaoxiangyii]QCB92670.1 hypothetical protein E5225_03000 [Cellulomonas shaoxiangyii]TGY83433.1 hypothetical protein E5226_12150 [Cellulomonas shaoxiangyii]
MSAIVVDYTTLGRSEQLLDRQAQHLRAVEPYLRSHGDIRDSTGALLALLVPLSMATVELGAQVARGAARVAELTADHVRATSTTYAEADQAACANLDDLATGLGSAPAPWQDPRGGVPPLGAAQESAPSDHGDADSWLGSKAQGVGTSVRDAVADARGIGEDVSRWGSPGQVVEVVDASSYLVVPQATDNPVQDLRWNAGVLLGSIDWVAEKLLGISVLAECVFKPLGGDWRAIKCSAAAWGFAGEAYAATGRNCAGLVASTTAGWQGAAGDAFRVTMAAYAAACAGLQAACDHVSGLVSNIALVSSLACSGIGLGLRTIAEVLTQLAAEASVPVVGWAVGAATIWWKIEKVVGIVRMIYNILEGLADAIASFVDAKTSVLDAIDLVEDLVSGLAARTPVAA